MIIGKGEINMSSFRKWKDVKREIESDFTQDDLDEISLNGIKIYSLCTTLSNEISSFFTTVKAFLGGLGTDPNHILPYMRPSIPEEMVEANLRLLKVYNNYVPKRKSKHNFNRISIQNKIEKSKKAFA